jgi:predicted MFS family arabinose efflux permease
VLLAVLANVMAAPVLLFAPFTGAWVDRWNLRRVLIVTDLLRAGLIALVPLLYPLANSLAMVYALVFALFTCNLFFLPAKSAITPEIVPPAQLLGANALLTLAGVLGTMVGAPLGGWMVDHWGWPRVLVVNAATYLVSVASLWRIVYRPHAHHAAPPASSWAGYLREVGDGWRVVRHSAPVGLALTALAAVWVGGGFLNAAGNPHVMRAASIPGMERAGVLLLVLGAGSALGTWWVNTRGRALPRAVLLGGGLLIVSAGLTAFALSSLFVVFAGAAFLIGVAAAPAYVLSETLLQEGTEPRQRGRVFSARDFVMRLVFVVGGTAAGFLTRSAGTRAALLVCGGLVAAAGMAALAWGRRMPGSSDAARSVPDAG